MRLFRGRDDHPSHDEPVAKHLSTWLALALLAKIAIVIYVALLDGDVVFPHG